MIGIAGIWLSFLCTVGINVLVHSYNEFRRLQIYLEYESEQKMLLFSLVSVIISHIPVIYFFMSAPVVFLD